MNDIVRGRRSAVPGQAGRADSPAPSAPGGESPGNALREAATGSTPEGAPGLIFSRRFSPCPCCGSRRTRQRLRCEICGRAVCGPCLVIDLDGLTPMCLVCSREKHRTAMGYPARLYRGVDREGVQHCGRRERGDCPLATGVARGCGQPGRAARGAVRGRQSSGAGEAPPVPQEEREHRLAQRQGQGIDRLGFRASRPTYPEPGASPYGSVAGEAGGRG